MATEYESPLEKLLKDEGRKEGRKEGEEAALVRVVIKQLERFRPLRADERQIVSEARRETLEELATAMPTVASDLELKQLLGQLRRPE